MFAWMLGRECNVSSRIPFIVDVSKSTFEQLDELLTEVSDDMDGQNDWPPAQENECMAVACLNLLSLQVRTGWSTKTRVALQRTNV